MPDGPWSHAWRWEGYCHARRLYIETGDPDAFDNMIRLYDGGPEDYWKIKGDDPNIDNNSPYIDIVTEG